MATVTDGRPRNPGTNPAGPDHADRRGGQGEPGGPRTSVLHARARPPAAGRPHEQPPAPPRVLRSVLAALPSRAGAVRRLVAEQLAYSGLSDERLDDAVVAADELFANAVRHGSAGPGDTVTVTVERTPHEVRVHVADGSAELPRRRCADVGEESGRGLAIVAALTDDWGVAPPEPGGTGKRVWFSLGIRDVP